MSEIRQEEQSLVRKQNTVYFTNYQSAGRASSAVSSFHMFQNVNSKEVGLLVIVTLGSVIIFLVLVMLALLNIRLFVNKEQNSDLMKILKADENSEVTPIFTIDRNTSNNNLDEIEEILAEDDDQKDNSRNLLKQIKYCKTLF